MYTNLAVIASAFRVFDIQVRYRDHVAGPIANPSPPHTHTFTYRLANKGRGVRGVKIANFLENLRKKSPYISFF